ncbi:hypothetical protein [Rhodopseudomonas pseudopalustris]|nr:hypothetical protein [Rhodopseudomonas pseudopalustris]MBB1094405.1 hypothetical protein [Rhodopseudomonas palustris]
MAGETGTMMDDLPIVVDPVRFWSNFASATLTRLLPKPAALRYDVARAPK